MPVVDISVIKLAAIFEYLDPFPPVTVELAPPTKRRPNQKAHMYWWFASQQTTGRGNYSRIQGNSSAKSTYNRLQTVPGLLWIAEALGEEPEALRKAFSKALLFEKANSQGRCAAFREVIPWERIAELIHNPGGWMIDPALAPYLKYDKGWPFVSKRYEADYKKQIDKELG